MSIREIKNSPVNSGAGMSIREAFDVVNANFNYLTIEAIPEQIADAVANLSATFTGGNITLSTRILSNTDSTNTTTGAFVVDGGAGIGGNVNLAKNISVGQSLTANSATISSDISTLSLTASGAISSASLTTNNLAVADTITTDSITVSNVSTLGTTRNNGTLEVVGETTFRSNIFITGIAGVNTSGRLRGNTIVATGSTDSTNTTSGSLQVFGGAGIVGNVNVGQNLTVIGNVKISNSYVPSSPNSPGETGQVTWDTDNFYICVGTDQWIRFAKDTQAW
jgi:hypothetical protein